MPIPDRLLEVPKHQADCEITGKPFQVFSQSCSETPVFFIFSPQILTCCLLRPRPPPKLVPRARELSKAPREAQGNDFVVGRAILSATQCLLCWFLGSTRMSHSQLMNSVSVQMRRKEENVSPDYKTISAIQEAA